MTSSRPTSVFPQIRNFLSSAIIGTTLIAGAANAQAYSCVAQPAKVGIGTGLWGVNAQTATNDVGRVGARWYYTWTSQPAGGMRPSATFVPIVWGRQNATSKEISAIPRSSPALLGFNEPDNGDQSNMSVDEAINLWPKLEGTGLRLGSPAPSSSSPNPVGPVLDAGGWLPRFMTAAAQRRRRVDFIAMHYYTTNPDVTVMRSDLERVYQRYGKPIWVTEWALVDWNNQSRFTRSQTRDFLAAGTAMMDQLSFVERHAWFGMYDGGDGWNINTGLVSAGQLTPAGTVMAQQTCRN